MIPDLSARHATLSRLMLEILYGKRYVEMLFHIIDHTPLHRLWLSDPGRISKGSSSLGLSSGLPDLLPCALYECTRALAHTLRLTFTLDLSLRIIVRAPRHKEPLSDTEALETLDGAIAHEQGRRASRTLPYLMEMRTLIAAQGPGAPGPGGGAPDPGAALPQWMGALLGPGDSAAAEAPGADQEADGQRAQILPPLSPCLEEPEALFRPALAPMPLHCCLESPEALLPAPGGPAPQGRNAPAPQEAVETGSAQGPLACCLEEPEALLAAAQGPAPLHCCLESPEALLAALHFPRPGRQGAPEEDSGHRIRPRRTIGPRVPRRALDPRITLTLKIKGCVAHGHFNGDGSFTLMGGSTLARTPARQPPGPTLRDRARHAAQISDDFTLLSDLTFGSVSAAAKFVSFSSIDGTTRWKDPEGRSVAELILGKGGN
ncbi:MAG: DUF4357 domain-containing protein [Succinivibrionaceae bacterium]|nr:DUF4357 domain-containing protein [Succinivibrionaceae bacterium]